MKTERMQKLLLVSVPWLIIVGMIAGAYLPIFRGEKYLLPVKPRDPRDFFRGNYVDLQYDFSNLRGENVRIDLDPAVTYRFGDTLYLDLAKKDNEWKRDILDSLEKNRSYIELQHSVSGSIKK